MNTNEIDALRSQLADKIAELERVNAELEQTKREVLAAQATIKEIRGIAPTHAKEHGVE